MKINFNQTSINPVKYPAKCKVNKTNYADNMSFEGLGLLSQLIKFKQVNEGKFAKKFFLDNGKVSKEDCENILNSHPQTLVKAYKKLDNSIYGKCYTVSETPLTTTKAGYNLKNYFDKHFDNYRIISVGTSPANIAQAMEYLGAEVIYIPISGAKNVDSEFGLGFLKNKKINKLPNAIIISKYFKSKLPKNDNKTNILLDFTISGKTMGMLARILRQNTGIDADKFECYGLTDTLNSCIKEDVSGDMPSCQLSETEINEIRNDCMSQVIEQAVNVPHFILLGHEFMDIPGDLQDKYINSTGKSNSRVFTEFEKYSSEIGRAYSLCMYNELKKLNLV